MNFISILFGVLIGLAFSLAAAWLIESTDFKNGAIATTKGEYVCQYNDFADDWDCKEAL